MIARPVPHLHFILTSLGMSAAAASGVINACRYEGAWWAREMIRVAIRRRHQFA